MNKKQQTNERSLENYLFASDKARMYALVTDMMTAAQSSMAKTMKALETMDTQAAHEVLDADDIIDELEEQIDQECLYSIAMRQPLREDLRYVYAVMKIITDIERIGDQAVNISTCIIQYADENENVPMPKVAEMLEVGRQLREMGNHFLAAFKNEDSRILEMIRNMRLQSIQLCQSMMTELKVQLHSDISEKDVVRSVTAVDIFRHLRRVADHMINLAEKVYFIATGISPMTLKKQTGRQNNPYE